MVFVEVGDGEEEEEEEGEMAVVDGETAEWGTKSGELRFQVVLGPLTGEEMLAEAREEAVAEQIEVEDDGIGESEAKDGGAAETGGDIELGK